jgi:hypothetical protein
MVDIEELTVDDWWQIYWFKRFVELPFMHQLIWRARKGRE